jgi:hypothetical protein
MAINKFALQIQEELIREIESAQQKFIVFVKLIIPGSNLSMRTSFYIHDSKKIRQKNILMG